MTLLQSVAEKFGSVEKGYDFKFDREIREQVGASTLPFSGMDKSLNQMCELFLLKRCQLGQRCCYRHVRTDKMIVCKHWLRGLCKKGDDCEFLHQYDIAKMPVCYFFSNFGRCENKDCMYQHVSAEAKTQSCPWYARGFCKHGNQCKRKHVRKVMCPNYLIGFCPEGPDCEYEHPTFELPLGDGEKGVIKCHFCGEIGHKSNVCQKNPHALPTEITSRHNEILARVADPGAPKPKAGMPLSRNYLDSRPSLQQKLEEDKTIYSVPTLGADTETQPKAIGFADDTSSVHSSIPTKRARYRKDGDMGYGDGEAWGDEAMKMKQMEEQRNSRGRGRGNMRGGYQNVGNFRGGRGGGRGGYNNMNNQNGQKRDLRDKSQVTCFKCLQTGHYANECEIPKGTAGPGYNNFNANKIGRGGANLGAAPISEEQRQQLQQARMAREGQKTVMKPWGDV